MNRTAVLSRATVGGMMMKTGQFIAAVLVVLLTSWAGAQRPRQMARVPGEIIVQYRWPDIASEIYGPQSKIENPKSKIAGRPDSLHSLDAKHRLIRSRPLVAETKTKRPLSHRPLPGQKWADFDKWPQNQAARRLQAMSVLTFPADAPIDEICAAYRSDPNVVAAEPNWIGTLFAAPSDPLYPQQALDLSRIGMETAWAVQTGSPSVVAAVIDSGVDANHADLRNVLTADGYNFVENNTYITDDIGHGTRVAGIIGAQGNNGEGIAGVAYGVRILPLDVADSWGTVTSARAIAAVDYAVAHGANVINMSFGFYAKSDLFEQACNNAYAAGCALVASVGNENQCTSLVYPAGFDSVIGVA
ncbi:S8 family serine peptidase, partial [Candidatus Sumerlaeota bacterium]|nr:S8 family serine peptidase [Candidatus Sumerlaeota bacterium]